LWVIRIAELAVRRRRLIISNVAVATSTAIIISFLLPKHYRATASILPPDEEASLGGLMGLSAGHIAQAVTSFSLPILATPSDLYASIIKSDTVLVTTVDELNLVREFNSTSRWQAVDELKEQLSIRVEQQGIIRVEATAKNPELAARIANDLVDQLDSFNRELQQTKGRTFSSFLQRRMNEADSSLREAEQSIRLFQNKYKAVSLELQAEVLIKALAEQKGRLTTDEIELEIMRSTLSSDHPSMIAKRTEIAETRRRLLEIERGAQTRSDSVISALDLSLASIPDLSLQYAVLIRNLKIQEVTFELLSQQNEIYRLQAQRDTPTISVLDRARVPESAFKPRKRWIVVTVFLLSLLLTIGYVVFTASPPLIVGLDSESLSQMKTLWYSFWRRPLG